MDRLPEPINVSPLIRLARWSFLIVGIFYGASRQRYLAQREVHIREESLKRKAARDAKLQEEKLIASERDIDMISKLFTTPSK